MILQIVRIGVLLTLLVSLIACISSPSHTKVDGFRFNTIEVLNRTSDDIFNMKIEATKFHRKFACGVILRDSLCMNGFHTRTLQGNDIVISWEQNRRKHEIGPIRVEEPESYKKDQIYSVQFVFISHDLVEIKFKPSRY